MTFKNFISGVIAGLFGSILFFLFQYFHYFNLGYFGGFVLFIILVLTVVLALIIDYNWSKKSTFIKRTLIGFIAYLISLIIKNYSYLSETSLEDLQLFFLIGLGISTITALILKY